MEDNKFRYTPLTESELNACWEKHKKIIESFVKFNKYDEQKVYINEATVMAVIAKVHQRRKYFEYFHGIKMSDCKEAALIGFWYNKLRPICAVSKTISEDDLQIFDCINEKLAVYYIITMLQGLLEDKGLSVQPLEEMNQKFLKEMIYSLKYRDISKEALILLVEGIASFVGVDPYSDE